ncbi:nuclease [bacterium]|nr:MAG: nuclease [bacterium]
MLKRFLSLLILAVPLLASAQETVRVVGISDGDTVRVLTKDKRELKVRLNGIDAPEKTQAFGEKSRQWLAGKVFGKDVQLKSDGLDRYGRTLGTILVGDVNINLQSVKNGWSWWYRQYAAKRTDLQAAEQSARAAKVGIWSQPGAIEPWNYRRAPKGPNATKQARPGRVAASPVRRRPKPAATAAVVRSETVYITRTGSKYHRGGCRYLRSSQIAISLKEAQQNYDACSVCGG